MKHFKILLLSIFCLALSIQIQAQEETEEAEEAVETEEVTEVEEAVEIIEMPKNVVKANLLGVAIGGFSLAYERAFTKKISGAATARFMFLDFKDTETFSFNGIGAVDVEYGVNMQLFGILPEGRFYLGSFFEKTAPEGFFLSPYLGFTSVGFEVRSLTDNFIITGNTTLSFFEIGGTLGYQFLIADKVSLDLFAGLGASTFTWESVGVRVRSTTSNEIIDDLLQFSERLPLGITFAGALPRFGASIGIAF